MGKPQGLKGHEENFSSIIEINQRQRRVTGQPGAQAPGKKIKDSFKR
jgi:hypothetical protein